jgi:hypothetical protein
MAYTRRSVISLTPIHLQLALNIALIRFFEIILDSSIQYKTNTKLANTSRASVGLKISQTLLALMVNPCDDMILL